MSPDAAVDEEAAEDAMEAIQNSGLSGRLEIAAVNSAGMVVVAGDLEALDVFSDGLEDDTFRSKMRVQVAYHSHHMEEENIKQGMLDIIGSLDSPEKPLVPLYSTLHGAQVDGVVHEPMYWWRNMRESVNLYGAVRAAMEDGHRTFVEVGPHPVLSASIEAIAEEMNITDCAVLPTMKRKTPEVEFLETTFARLFVAGVNLDWTTQMSVDDGTENELKWLPDLPSYGWDTKHFWKRELAPATPMGALLDTRSEGSAIPTWTSRLDASRHRWLFDHKVQGQSIVPAAGYIEAALEAGCLLQKDTLKSIVGVDNMNAVVLRDIKFENPFGLGSKKEDGTWNATELQISVDHEDDGRFTVSSRTGQSKWVRHSRGRIANTSSSTYSSNDAGDIERDKEQDADGSPANLQSLC